MKLFWYVSQMDEGRLTKKGKAKENVERRSENFVGEEGFEIEKC